MPELRGPDTISTFSAFVKSIAVNSNDGIYGNVIFTALVLAARGLAIGSAFCYATSEVRVATLGVQFSAKPGSQRSKGATRTLEPLRMTWLLSSSEPSADPSGTNPVM